MPLCKKFNKESFSYKLVGLTGADISFIAIESGYNCIRRNIDVNKALRENISISSNISYDKYTINKEDFNKALNKIVNGIK